MTAAAAPNTKKTRFDYVEIRHYPVVLSNNPGGSFGPPIELGWEYDAHPHGGIDDGSGRSDIDNKLSIHLYEKERRVERRASFRLSHFKRKTMLKEANYTESELEGAMQRKDCVRRDRRVSNLAIHLNPVAKIRSVIRHDRRRKKLKKALTNLRKMGGDDSFFEHSEIYRGWTIPLFGIHIVPFRPHGSGRDGGGVTR
mmetsp:Transcript_26635/g.56661  ORF Transcript_26635/g.56661 Transcript_26635/m.56661 type:complete len:198 (+) Transcript_26635:201-794(+)